MNRRFPQVGVALILLGQLTFAAWAQEAAILHATESVDVPNQPAEFIISPIRCDQDQNILTRSPNSDGLDGGLIVKISRDGQKRIPFDSMLASLKKSRVIDFFPAQGGGLFVLVSGEKDTEQRYYILRFDADGSYQSKYLVPSPFRIQRIAAFPSGDFLVLGRKLPQPGSQTSMNSDPLVGIFDIGRQAVREVRIKGDIGPRTARGNESTRGAESGNSNADREYESALTMSSVMLGGDGNIYLTRRSPKGPVFAISAGGRVSHTIHLVPPQGAVLHSVQVGSRELAAEYREFSSDGTTVLATILELIDLHTGKVNAHFRAPLSFGSFACYQDGREFTFLLAGESGRLKIIRAVPE